jgi:peptidoglycan/LPS O-acetylase OafA/YrhL
MPASFVREMPVMPEMSAAAARSADFPLSDRPRERQVWLDVLRAVAILFVASGHMVAKFAIPRELPTLGKPIWQMLIQLAVAGVDIFYVLSGFLIGGMLFSELRDTARIGVGRFWLRRALRLWPPYFLAVLFAWQWYRFVPTMVEGQRMMPPSLADMWPFFFQVQNYYDLYAHHKLNIGAVMQTWTLASLVHFYLIIPPVLLLLVRLGALRALPWLVAAVFAMCFTFRYRAAPLNADAYDAWRQYFPTHLRLDEPMAGVLAAYWVVYFRQPTQRVIGRLWPLLLLLGLAAWAPVAVRKEEGPRFLVIWGYTLAGVGCVPLALVAWYFSQPRPHETRRRVIAPVRWFSYIGAWSYSIYLWHQPSAQFIAPKVRDVLFRAMVRAHLDPWHSRLQYLISATIYFTIAVGIGAVMYYLIERPTLLLRDRLIPRPTAADDGADAVPRFVEPAKSVA